MATQAVKRNPADFMLWKPDSKHLMRWSSPWGEGYPGWHLECSVMARAILGDVIDLHSGGEDNIFPHHECEIAQSCGATGEESFARYWFHTRHLMVDGGKMSKSLGNVWNVDDVIERGYESRALRFALLRGHYRQPLNFTWDILAESARALEGLDDLVNRLKRLTDGADAGAEQVKAAGSAFREAMNDDLNVPKALAALFVLRSDVLDGAVKGASAEAALALLGRADGVLGVLKTEESAEGGEDDAEVDALVAARQAAREAKDWAAADRARDELNALGIVVEDTSDGGTAWFRK
jgi:cysteinyl-tRNA synthetase